MRKEAFDRTLWRTRFGRDCEPVVRECGMNGQPFYTIYKNTVYKNTVNGVLREVVHGLRQGIHFHLNIIDFTAHWQMLIPSIPVRKVRRYLRRFSRNSQSGKIPDRGGLFIIILQNTYILEVITNKKQ